MRTGVYNAKTGRAIYAFLHAKTLTIKCQRPIVLNVAIQLESKRRHIMATKVLVILASGDREVALEVGLVYPLNAIKNRWMDEVKLIIFGPSEKIAAHDMEVRGRLDELRKAGIEVMACKWCADRMKITAALEDAGIKVVYVGAIISQMLRDGWASLTF
jgi:hypothetical protein